VKPLFKN